MSVTVSQATQGKASIFGVTQRTASGKASIRGFSTQTIGGTACIYIPEFLNLPHGFEVVGGGKSGIDVAAHQTGVFVSNGHSAVEIDLGDTGFVPVGGNLSALEIEE